VAASDPEQRRLIARHAALTKHALGDPRANTEPARRAALARFEQQVQAKADERGEQLTPAELARRADRLRRAYFTDLSRRAALARKARASSRGDPP
jgi:hypothetical protein